MRLSCLLAFCGVALGWGGLQAAEVTIDIGQRSQAIEGFGLGLDEAVVEAASYNALWQDVFSRKMGLSILKAEWSTQVLERLQEGEVPPIFTKSRDVARFDFDRSRFMTLEAQLAQKLREQVKDDFRVIATSRSAPHWLKIGAWWAGNNGVTCGGRLRNDQKSLEQFGHYLALYSQAWAKASGTPAYSVGLQREPRFQLDVESMELPVPDYSDALQATSEAMTRLRVSARLHGPEDVGIGTASNKWPLRVQSDFLEELRKHGNLKLLTAWAMHGFAGDAAGEKGIYREGWSEWGKKIADEGKPLWITEGSLGAPEWDDPRGPIFTAVSIHEALVYGRATMWIGWLGKPRISASAANIKPTDIQRLLGEGIDPANARITLPVLDFIRQTVALRHYSSFIRPGSVEVGLTLEDPASSILASAYYHPRKGGLTLVLINPSSHEEVFTFRLVRGPNYMNLRHYLSAPSIPDPFTRMPDVKLVDGKAEIRMPTRSIATLTTLE